MSVFYNVTIGSYDDGSNRYAKVWFDETEVARFSWHSILTRDVMKATHHVYGVSVEARHVFSAADAFNSFPGMAVRPDGREVFCTWTRWNGGPNEGVEEFHLGDKYGRVVARMTPTGYMQHEEITQDKAKEAA
jgi:hypothetical protein